MFLLIAIINFVSAFAQAASGFGYAIIAMFFMPMFLPFQQCSVISAGVIIIIAIQMVISLRKHICINKIIVPMIFCLIMTILGIWIINVINETVARKIMGVFLILLSFYFYYTKKHKIFIKYNFFNSMIIGMLTGLSTGMFNIVGPFLTLYYYDNCENNLEFKGNLELSFLIAGTFSFVINIFYVGLSPFLIKHLIFSGIAVVISGIIGLKVFYKINKEKLKYIIICFMPIMGIVQIIK